MESVSDNFILITYFSGILLHKSQNKVSWNWLASIKFGPGSGVRKCTRELFWLKRGQMTRFLFLLPRDGFPLFGNSSYFSTRVGFHLLLLHDETSFLEKFLEVMGEGDIAGKHELSVRQTKELFTYRKVWQFDQND